MRRKNPRGGSLWGFLVSMKTMIDIKKEAVWNSIQLHDLSGNRTRVYAVRGRRLDRLTIRPYAVLFCLFATDLYMIARPDGFVKYFLKKVESFFE